MTSNNTLLHLALAWNAAFSGLSAILMAVSANWLSAQLDNGKARRELHWNPRPIAETIRDAVAWYAQREGN